MEHWPHGPSRVATGPGPYIVTAATLQKERIFNDSPKLDLLEKILLTTYQEAEFSVQAWAVFPNHYHTVGSASPKGIDLARVSRKVHANSAREVNRLDNLAGRQVWFQYWDQQLTFEKAYLARLAYVHHNAVHHGVVRDAETYRWCSAKWFRARADVAWYETVTSFKTDSVKVIDDF